MRLETNASNPSAIREALCLQSFVSTQIDVRGAVTVAGKPRSARSAVSRLLLFLSLTVATFSVIDQLIDKGVRTIKTSSFGVFNRIIDGRINTAIIISGSSRALNNFDPRLIEGPTGLTAFNIGIDGSQTDMQLAVFDTYLRHNVKPSLLIQSLDSFAFVTSRSGVAEAQYVPYLNEQPIYRALSAVEVNTWKSRYVPLYGYATDLNFTWWAGVRGLLGWNPREDRYLGFGPRNAQWTGEFERFSRERRAGVRFEIEPEGVRVFEELMRLCKDQGIRVLLVYSPVYYEMQALETNREEIFRRFKDIAQRYDVPFWDYSRSPISFRKEYFVNSEHLNAKGAAVFSADLATALKRSGLVHAK
jgi:hypothetical protein